MRRVIINADDFGLSPGVNRGILEAFRHGILSSTTMLVNLAHFDDAVGLAADNPDLPVGVHLSLLWGPPVSDPATVPTLIERDGCFPRSLLVLARRYALGRLCVDQVRMELRAQMARFRGAGLTPTHVDTHKHVHCLPGILAAVADVAAECGVHRARLPYEERLGHSGGMGRAQPRPALKARLKSRIVGYFCRHGRAALAHRGVLM